MKFFKPDDFFPYSEEARISVANAANAKLEREGFKVFSQDKVGPFHRSDPFKDNKYRGLLIDIEEVGACEHPKEKVKFHLRLVKRGLMTSESFDGEHICECGSKVEPTSFKPIDTP